jgi:hypothetical protein
MEDLQVLCKPCHRKAHIPAPPDLVEVAVEDIPF